MLIISNISVYCTDELHAKHKAGRTCEFITTRVLIAVFQINIRFACWRWDQINTLKWTLKRLSWLK